MEALKRVGTLSSTFADPINYCLSDHDLYQRLDTRLAQLIDSFADIAAILRKLERERDLAYAFRKLPPEPATKEDLAELKETTEKTERKVDVVIVKQEETRKAVNRIDKRDKRVKKNARQRFSIEKQELAFGYWDRGHVKPEVKKLAENGRKVKHEHVFAYYKDELIAAGFKNAAAYDSCLGCRSDRIRRERAKKLSTDK